MRKRVVFPILLVLALGLAGNVRAQTILTVPPNHTVSGSETYHQMDVNEGGTVTVPIGASLTIEIQGEGDDYDKVCNIDGGTLVVEGDFLCHQGEGRMNTQIDSTEQSTIIMDGNSYAVTGWFQLGDEDIGSTAMYVRAGTTTIGSETDGYMSLRGERGARAYIGGGELIIYNTSTGQERDPHEWLSQGWLLPDAGYGRVNIEDNYGGVAGCARITAAAGTPFAREPIIPTDGATDVCPEGVVLSWTTGDKAQDANAHEIYFGTSEQLVTDANIDEPCGVYMGAQDRDSNTYALGALELAKTYYWRVDEVNEDDPNLRWEGDVWQFTTENGKAHALWPTDGLKGIAYEQVVLEWEPSCLVGSQKLYLGTEWPVVLFEDDFDDGLGQWSNSGWGIYNATGDSNFSPHDHNLAYATSGGGTKTLTADINAVSTEANSIRIDFWFRKTEEIVDGEIKLYYWDGLGWDEVNDLNSLPGPNDAWLHYIDSITDSQYLISDFKIKFEASISSGGTVYIDDVTVTNTWPVGADWHEADLAAADNNYVPSLEPFKWYYWRIDGVAGGTPQGDTWDFRTGLGGVLVHFRFDGTPGEDLEPNVTDSTGNVTFTKVIGNPAGSLKYSADNGFGLSTAASCEFTPRASLVRDDPAPPEGFDILRLDVYQYTVEFWIKLDDVFGDTELFRKEGYMEIDEPEQNYTKLRWFHPHEDMYSDDEAVPLGEWNHIACVFDTTDVDNEMKMWINGISQGTASEDNLLPGDNTKAFKIGQGNEWLDGKMDELRILDVALDREDFLWTPGPEWASNPHPHHMTVGIDANDPNVFITWTPGTEAVTHKVYFSTNYDDVYDSCSVALVAQIPLESNSWPTDGNGLDLDFGHTYYWRITEVNEAVYPYEWEGVIWRFTTRFLIVDPQMRVWYRFNDGEGQTVIDASGYEHHAEATRDPVVFPTWDPNGQFDGCLVFDDDTRVEVPSDTLSSLSLSDSITVSVWLYGQQDPYLARDNYVLDVGEGDYYLQVMVPDETGRVYWRAGNDSNDALAWTVDTTGWNDHWHHLAFVKNEDTDKMYIYFDGDVGWWKPGGTISSLSNIANKPFRIGAKLGNIGDYIGKMDDFRIYDVAKPESEIESLYRGGDLGSAWGPSPYDGQADAPRDANLIWNAGNYADSHDVYFGTDYAAVRDANTSVTLGVFRGHTADTVNDIEILDLDTWYYWRIDEVNDSNGAMWKGKVWKFKVAEHIIIDDFESYEDNSHLQATWIWAYSQEPQTGSVLYLANYSVIYPAHGGDQIMRYGYDTYKDPQTYLNYAEAHLPLTGSRQDWTDADVRSLTLFFYGLPSNDVTEKEQMYVGVEDTSDTYAEIRYGDYDPDHEDINDLNEPEWHEWFVALPDFNDSNYAAVAADVNFSNVKRLYIGFGNRRTRPPGGGSGEVRFDDIRLHLPTCRPELVKPIGDFAGGIGGQPDCIVDIADVGYMAQEWLRSDVNLAAIVELQEPCDANLVAHWTLDGDPCDSSSYNHHGSLEGNYSWVVGYDDEHPAIEFTGSGGRLLVPDDDNTPALRPEHQVSVSAWVYFSDGQSDARAIVKGEDDHEAYEVEIKGTDDFVFRIGDTNGTNRPTVEGDVRPDEWLHVAGTYDGNDLKCYLNGELEDSRDANVPLLSQNTYGLAIGNRSDATDKPFIGAVDEVCVYDYGLSHGEVAWLATDGTGFTKLNSQANIYDLEVPGKKAVNFRDIAKLIAEHWLEEKKWP